MSRSTAWILMFWRFSKITVPDKTSPSHYWSIHGIRTDYIENRNFMLKSTSVFKYEPDANYKHLHVFIYLETRQGQTQFYLVRNTSLNPDEYYPINLVFLCSFSVSHERSCRCKWQMIIFWDSHLSCSHRHSQTVAFTDVILYWKSRLKGPTFYLFSSLVILHSTGAALLN